jgi:hypothetical protein
MGRLIIQPNSLLRNNEMCVLLPNTERICLGDIGYIAGWFEYTCGQDIRRAMERVELVLSQEEMDREDLKGQNHPIEIVRGLNLKGKPDFRWSSNDATNWEGCGPCKWRPVP